MAHYPCAIGVDLGSSGFVMSAVRRGGVDVLVNDANYRSTPNVIIYGKERAIGDQAVSKIKKELKNSIVMAPRFLGDLTPQQVSFEANFNYSKVVTKENGGAAFVVNSNGQTVEIAPQQAVGALFTKMSQVMDMNGVVPSSLVVSVPKYYGPVERQAVLDSAKIAGLEITQLISESSATLLNYGIYRKQELSKETPRVVVFVDVGHSKSTVIAAKMFQERAEPIFEFSDANLGSRNLDLIMFDYYSKLVSQKFGKNISDFPKSKQRLFEAIEKQRKLLTANQEASISVDCIIDEQDFGHLIKREEYYTLCAPVFHQFAELLAAGADKLKGLEIHSVEKQGGASRIPKIEQIMLEAFGVPCISKTTDATECIARGCAIRAAMVSPTTRVAHNFTIKEKLEIAIKGRLRYESDPATKEVVIFDASCEAAQSKSITVARNEKLFFELFTNRPLLSGHLDRSSATAEKVDGKLVFVLDANFIPRVEKGEFKETSTANSGMEIEGEENKPKEVQISHVIAPTCNKLFGLDKGTLTHFTGLETDLLTLEKLIQDTQKAKYNLESYIYDAREDFGKAKYAQLTTHEEREAFTHELTPVENWLYDDGANSDKDTYFNKLGELRSKMHPFYARKEKIDHLENFLVEAPKELEKVNNLRDIIAHGTPEKQKAIADLVAKNHALLAEMNTFITTITPKTIDAFHYFQKKDAFAANINEAIKIAKEIDKATREAAEKKRKEEEEAKKKEEEAKKKEEEAKKHAEDPKKHAEEAKNSHPPAENQAPTS